MGCSYVRCGSAGFERRGGNRAGAAEQFREALKADPEFRAARDALRRLGQN